MRIDDWTPWRALTRRVDLWHLHHPDTVVYPRSAVRSFIGTVLFWLLLQSARCRRIRIVWTVHDLDNNDGLHPWLEAWFWRFYLPHVDAFICLTRASIQLARQRFTPLQGKPGFVIEHGHYRDAYPNVMSRQKARATLGLSSSARVVLQFGLIRPFKNVPHLIDTFKALEDPDLVLLVAGNPYDARMEHEVRQRAEGCPNVRMDLHWIAPEEVQKYFAACDLVALPYRRYLNSGAAMLALTFARPVLMPDSGTMREQQKTFGAEWITLYEGELTAPVLAEACRKSVGVKEAEPDLKRFGWAGLAHRTVEVYQYVLTQAGVSNDAPSTIPGAVGAIGSVEERSDLRPDL